MEADVDFLIVGGGFYGCSLALFLRSISSRIVLVEARHTLLSRASRVNQARIHAGFHYPRSALTAVKSLVLHKRFAADFPDAIIDDFRMLYGVARLRSKVSAKRFYRMFADLGAPIAPADPSMAALFDPAMIEAAFVCEEHAFDYSVLRRHIENRLDALDIDLRFDTEVRKIEIRPDGAIAHLSTGEALHARHVFNVTYAGINTLLRSSGLAEAHLKYELAEIALIEPPGPLEGVGITVVDGPFMSCMPYPTERLHSLTHVRYTPHFSSTDDAVMRRAFSAFGGADPPTNQRRMLLDGKRYIPCLADARWRHSLYEIKTVLAKNEKDDGRPTLYQRQPQDSRLISIMGGKIDNVYDLFDLVRTSAPEWSAADDRFLRDGLQRG